jgi:hypothetical protein
MTAVQWLDHYWGWVVFWCIVLGVPGSIAEFFRRTARVRHRRRLELIKARSKAQQRARGGAVGDGQRSITGCSHVQVVPVRLADGTLVRWVCANPVCAREFPPESAILAEED